MASPKVEKYNRSIRPNLLINFGTKGAAQKLAKAPILIKRPKMSSLTLCLVAMPGKRGAII